MKKLLSAACVIFFTAVFAYANVGVSPSRIDITIEKDDVFASSYTVVNTYDRDVDIDISLQDWNSYKGNGALDVNSWLKFDTMKIRLKPGETKVIPYEIRTTSSMQGSVSAMVSFSHRPPGNESVMVKISCSIYLTIRNTEKIDFFIDEIQLSRIGQNAVYAYVKITNNGNVHVRPSGTLNIYKGKKLLVSSVIPEKFPTYAGSVGGYRSNDLDIAGLKPGKYVAEVVMNALGKSVSKKIEFRIKKDGIVIQ